MAICVSVIASSRKPSVIAVCIAGAPAEDPEMVSWWANYYHYFPSDLTITHGKLSRGLSGHKRGHLQAVCRLESLPFLCADKMGREIVSTCLCWCGVGWVLIKGIFFSYYNVDDCYQGGRLGLATPGRFCHLIQYVFPTADTHSYSHMQPYML